MQLRVLRELHFSHGARLSWPSSPLRLGPNRRHPQSRADRLGARMAAATAGSSSQAKPDPVVQYVVIRSDLAEMGWPLGAIIAQVG